VRCESSPMVSTMVGNSCAGILFMKNSLAQAA
jgi:hypothetical protein